MSQKLSLSSIWGTWNIYLGLAWKIQHFFKLIGFPLTTFLLDYKQHFCIFWFMLRSKGRSTEDMIVTRRSSCGWSLTETRLTRLTGLTGLHQSSDTWLTGSRFSQDLECPDNGEVSVCYCCTNYSAQRRGQFVCSCENHEWQTSLVCQGKNIYQLPFRQFSTWLTCSTRP